MKGFLAFICGVMLWAFGHVIPDNQKMPRLAYYTAVVAMIIFNVVLALTV